MCVLITPLSLLWVSFIVRFRLFIMRYIKRGYPNGVSNKCDAIRKAATSNLGVDLHDIVLRIAEEQRPVAPSCQIGRLPGDLGSERSTRSSSSCRPRSARFNCLSVNVGSGNRQSAQIQGPRPSYLSNWRASVNRRERRWQQGGRFTGLLLRTGVAGILDWAPGDNFAPLSIWNAAVRLMGRRQRCGGGLGEATDSPGSRSDGTEQPYRGEHHGSEGRSACEAVRGQG